MKFHAADVVRATPGETFAWWTDVRVDDAGGVMPPLRTRRIMRCSTTEIEVEDRWSIYGIPMRVRAVLRPMPPDAWEVASTFRGGTYRDAVRLTPVAGGTRVAMEIEMGTLRWPWSWGVRLLRLPLARLFQKDMEAVDRALEASLIRAPGSATPTPPGSATPSGSTPQP